MVAADVKPDDRALGVQDRAGAEEADTGDDLRRDAGRVAVRAAVRREADLRDVDRELREQRRADADQNVRAQPSRFVRQLALDADGAAEERGEQQLDEDREAERRRQRGERRRSGSILHDERGELGHHRD